MTRDLVWQLDHYNKQRERKPLRILEIGPGTGPLTKQIVRRLKPEDHFDVVELNDHFFELISGAFKGPNISVYHTDILNFDVNEPYDYIFSSLPYESIPQSISRKIWMKKLALCGEKTYISYYKYINIKRFRCAFEKRMVKQYEHDSNFVFLNLPPAKRFTLEIRKDDLPATIKQLRSTVKENAVVANRDNTPEKVAATA